MNVDFSEGNRHSVFWSCFMAIAATAAVFSVRGLVMPQWEAEFGLTKTQMGELGGVGLWPFAVSIVLFSLVIDRIGYGKAMLFAFVCHVVSTVILLNATGYWGLYFGTFLVSLGNGAAQAVADPVVASMYTKDKTKWLNILHASWPGGMVVGGLGAIVLSSIDFGVTVDDRIVYLDWRWPVAALFVPIIIYGVLMIGRKFPVHERVSAGVSYRDMLKETGGLGMFLVSVLMFAELARVFDVNWIYSVGAAFAASLTFGIYARSLGNPMFLLLLVLMVPLATTELGTDSWITSLMEVPMKQLGVHAGWVLVYTSLIMMGLRFCAGPVVKLLSPIGLMVISCSLAGLGLVALSKAEGVGILLAATLYGVGKTYLWPTVLGIVAERFPRGGALSLNVISAVGMMSVGVVGMVFMGMVQDHKVDALLKTEQPTIYQQVVVRKQSVMGEYSAADPEKVKLLSEKEQNIVKELTFVANKDALLVTAVLPAFMLFGYLCLWIYFNASGGYVAVHLTKDAHKQE